MPGAGGGGSAGGISGVRRDIHFECSIEGHMTNSQWRLAARPTGDIKETDFAWGEEPIPEPVEGQFRARVIYLSLDPTNRVWMNGVDSYLPALPLGAVMRGGTLSVVEKSNNPKFKEGDIVQGLGGWQQYYVSDGTGQAAIPRVPGLPLDAWFGAMAHIGFTAYFGLFNIGRPKPGETLVVSAAAGAVGSLAGQMGKIAGCRVVGIAGADDKCEWITKDLGFDAAINYKTENVRDALKKHCPKGIDIDFENVGGEIFEAVLDRIALGARIALCGMISQYNSTEAPRGPANFGNLLTKRALLQGFIVTDFAPQFPDAIKAIVPWLMEGKLKYRVDVSEGLKEAPKSLMKLFNGSNTGKLLVKVSPEPAA